MIPLSEFSDRVSKILPKLIKQIYEYEIQVIARGELTVSKLQFLDCLAEEEITTMKTVAEYAGLKCPSATAVADQMIAQGLIKRKSGESDRRTVSVYLTEKGKRLHQAIQNERKKGVNETFKTISAKERSMYLEIIEKLSANMASNQFQAASKKTVKT